jgi:hypothetical protein
MGDTSGLSQPRSPAFQRITDAGQVGGHWQIGVLHYVNGIVGSAGVGATCAVSDRHASGPAAQGFAHSPTAGT